MSNPNPKNQFKKGNTPMGHRQKESPEYKAAKVMNAHELAIIIHELMYLDFAQLKALLKDPKIPIGKLCVGSVMRRMIQDGDPRSFDCIFNRIVGKVADKLEGANGEPLSVIAIIQRANKRSEES